MLKAWCKKYILHFRQPAGTSRGVLLNKETWFMTIWDEQDPAVFGIGECAVFRGLSSDDLPGYENKIQETCRNINDHSFLEEELVSWPSIRFGVESAVKDQQNGGKRILFPSHFTDGQAGIPINGLIWMGTPEFMKQQVRKKLDDGFRCIKFKVGAVSLKDELALMKLLRDEFDENTLTIRLDANGAFTEDKVFDILEQFSRYKIHSIEQPVKDGNAELMEKVCRNSPVPVALDEELIGIHHPKEKEQLLSFIKPQYIILKPALIGGFSGAQQWINMAEQLKIDWWITSALESNIGLNAIAQWTFSLQSELVQGLGTGGLYTNNIPSPLEIIGQELWISKDKKWELDHLANE